MQATIATITKCQQEAGITEVSLLNFVVSDGNNMIATRYVSHDSESPASLYYAEGSAFQREPPESGVRPESAKPGAASNAASARNTAVTGVYCLLCCFCYRFLLYFLGCVDTAVKLLQMRSVAGTNCSPHGCQTCMGSAASSSTLRHKYERHAAYVCTVSKPHAGQLCCSQSNCLTIAEATCKSYFVCCQCMDGQSIMCN